MIMSSMKNKHTKREQLLQELPVDAGKWVSNLTDMEIEQSYKEAESEYTEDNYDLFIGELYDRIKDRVVEKQAYLVKNFNLEINDEEIKSEVDDYIKRKMN